MESGQTSRPRVSRETRLLVTTALLAVVALWLLARIRFPGVPAASDPVPPILTTLGPGRDYDGLAAALGQVRARIGNGLVAVDLLTAPGASDEEVRDEGVALRLDGDVAITWLRPRQRVDPAAGGQLVARDAATGLAVVRLPGSTPATTPTLFTPRQLQRPRYVLASHVSAAGVSLRPVFVSSMAPVDAPRWDAVAWLLPPRVDAVEGEWLFTSDAALAGLVVASRSGLSVVPGEAVLTDARRLIERAAVPTGDAGVQVQTLTPALAAVTGAAAGVVVSWVSPQGASRGRLRARDVIEAVDDVRVPTFEHWQRRAAQFAAGTAVSLTVRRDGDVVTVPVVPAPSGNAVPNLAASSARRGGGEGFTTRRVAGLGAQVMQVVAGTPAARAGLAAGDLITSVGDVISPTPDQVRTMVAGAAKGDAVVVAVQRGREHLLLVLQP